MMRAIPMEFESGHPPLHAPVSEAVTNNVRVEVRSNFAPEHSQPFQGVWSFYYTKATRPSS
jgi:hypothetical protein